MAERSYLMEKISAVMTKEDDLYYAKLRRPGRLYISKHFSAFCGQDYGSPSRYIRLVFEKGTSSINDEWDRDLVVKTGNIGEKMQIEMQLVRESGLVRKIAFQKIDHSQGREELKTIVRLDRDESSKLINAVKELERIPIEGEREVRVDDQLIEDVFKDPSALRDMYSNNSSIFRELIEEDLQAEDVVALGRRRNVVRKLRRWLEDEEEFLHEKKSAGGSERVWQNVLEENPWILGIGLGGQLLTSWNPEKLEQTVVGSSVKGPGKRVDALLETVGVIPSLVFAEIKHHKTDLLTNEEYRPGAFSPSRELTGAVAQIQQTVHLAVQEIGDKIEKRFKDQPGSPGPTLVMQPRSFVIIGSLDQLMGEGDVVDMQRYRSFEIYRRNLLRPEILTFDELVKRAEWHVERLSDLGSRADL